eukprot:2428994-Pleurochrysis_carterae.AAC.1
MASRRKSHRLSLETISVDAPNQGKNSRNCQITGGDSQDHHLQSILRLRRNHLPRRHRGHEPGLSSRPQVRSAREDFANARPRKGLRGGGEGAAEGDVKGRGGREGRGVIQEDRKQSGDGDRGRWGKQKEWKKDGEGTGGRNGRIGRKKCTEPGQRCGAGASRDEERREENKEGGRSRKAHRKWKKVGVGYAA